MRKNFFHSFLSNNFVLVRKVCSALIACLFFVNATLSFSGDSISRSVMSSDYPAWVNFGGKAGDHSRALGLMDFFIPVKQ